jgi:transcriptional regulator with XRE-family HTH domain
VLKEWSASSLGERIRHMAELRAVSLNALGRRAGIDSGPMSRLSRRGSTAALDTLRKLADAWEFHFEWLAFGRGQPEGPGAPTNALQPVRYTHRFEAARIARDGGVPLDAIESVCMDRLDPRVDPPVLWWLDRMRERVALLAVAPREPRNPRRKEEAEES